MAAGNAEVDDDQRHSTLLFGLLLGRLLEEAFFSDVSVKGCELDVLHFLSLKFWHEILLHVIFFGLCFLLKILLIWIGLCVEVNSVLLS